MVNQVDRLDRSQDDGNKTATTKLEQNSHANMVTTKCNNVRLMKVSIVRPETWHNGLSEPSYAESKSHTFYQFDAAPYEACRRMIVYVEIHFLDLGGENMHNPSFQRRLDRPERIEV